MILGIASKNLQAMAANRYHAGLIVLVLLFFCTFGRCTVLLGFGRNGNNITLRCVDDLSIAIPNANFFVRTPESSSGQPVQNFTRVQNGVIMFTLTPETEGYFSCQDPSTQNESSEELLLAGEKYKVPSLKYLPVVQLAIECMPLDFFLLLTGISLNYQKQHKIFTCPTLTCLHFNYKLRYG